MKLKFPEKFFWGAATSAHQVEGGCNNDWSKWEKENAARLAERAKTHWQKWQQERFPEMFKPENYISGKACDHYNRFCEDFDIALSLGQNAHRFSIEWSRIEPEEGKFDEKEIKHYQKIISALRERGIEPFITINHWTLPLWFEDVGGWEHDDAVFHFSEFVGYLARNLKDVKFWIVFNEPWIYISHSYIRGKWPPAKKSWISVFRVLRVLIRSHKISFDIIKSVSPQAKVGIAENNVYFEGWRLIQQAANYFVNNYFLKKIKNHLDFIGLNYYFHNKIKGFRFNKNDNEFITDMGWEIYPEGIYHVLKDLRDYDKPIYITENGLADSRDIERTKFIKDHLYWTHKAIEEGVDVRGYFYWSLLDNFEWDKGFWPRFGLVEIDYLPRGKAGQALERRVRKSALEYAEICKNNGFEYII
ncbi:MAG: glycoside hydrolase family 1 protein [Candidatus Pacebacteria bacterium]|nr:glycoside hydrolase family 1 protein [Candidatus Paceibacterota bacterium]